MIRAEDTNIPEPPSVSDTSVPIIEARDLHKSYALGHRQLEVLRGVGLTVNHGEFLALRGASGAGKSTLLNTISGVVKKRSGEILLNGKLLPTMPHKIVKAGIIQVPEGRKVFSGLTVRENLIMGGSRLPASASKDKFDRMYSLYPILGKRREQAAGTLSGGEQQMLAIARGLMAEPEILLLDEPSLGLAPIIVSQVFETIKEINKLGITILLVEQNAGKAMEISDVTYVLETSHIVMSGKSEELRKNENIRKAYLGK
jgi:branched-chain amino acid transport system ATP-binding protein